MEAGEQILLDYSLWANARIQELHTQLEKARRERDIQIRANVILGDTAERLEIEVARLTRLGDALADALTKEEWIAALAAWRDRDKEEG